MEVCVVSSYTNTRMGLTVQDKEKDSSQMGSRAAMKDGLQVSDRSAELEKKLRTRAERDHLVQKNILPAFSSSPILFTYAKELQKKQNADCLKKKLQNRPERQNLMEMNILPVDLIANVDPGLMSKQIMLKRNRLADTLNRKLASRPGPLELIQGRILEPHNPELSEVVPDVMRRVFDQDKASVTQQAAGGPGGASITSPQADDLSPSSKDVISPQSDTSHPHSPEEMSSPLGGSRGGIMSPPFNLLPLVPPSPRQVTCAVQTPGIMAASRKSLSPSQARKKQQKQKYRKLRYHEYVPPTKNNSKGGKTNPKPLPKQETPYNHILQQQQLFLQLQVLQQQYPNGVLMQKLPDIVDSLSKSGKAAGKGKATSPSGLSGIGGSLPISVPQIVMVEQPNQFQLASIRFEELKVSDLKAACKELGMIVSGKKAELVERLLEHNNGCLPVIALPETQARDAQRSQAVRPMHTGMLDPHISSMSGFSPPSPTSLSPVFKFPADQNNGRSLANDATTSGSVMAGGRKSSLSSLSSMGSAQVIPALSLQQQFDELVERQKRSYICQGQAPKSLAPRPELGDLVAIKFPRPVETQPRSVGRGGDSNNQPSQQQQQQQQQQQHSGRGVTLPRQGSGGSNNTTNESKMVLSPFPKQSHSLPSSPQPLSPSNSTSQLIGELMDDSSSSDQPKSLLLQATSTGSNNNRRGSGGKATPPPLTKTQHQQQQSYMSSVPSCSSITTTSNGLSFSGSYSHTNHHTPLMATSSYYSQQQPNTKPPLRQSHSISSVPGRSGATNMLPPKLHLSNPPPPPYGSNNSGMMHRSMSLTNPYQHGLHHPRLHSGASFSSDTGEMLNPQEGLFFQEDMVPHTTMDVPMDAQMDTQDSATHHDLSEIFSILEADTTAGFAVPGQPPSYSTKLASGHRQDSLRSDSIMLGSSITYQTPNPPLSLVHKSNSDLCLVDSAHKHTMNPPPYNGAMLGAGVGWLDPPDGSGMMSDVSPTVGSLGLNNSNPGSLTHEGFQMNFLDDINKHTPNPNNASMNGFGQSEYLTHSLPTSSGLLHVFQQDESQTLLELGLSTS